MTDFNFNVNNDEAVEFGALPKGEYEFFITGAKVSKPSANGNLGLQMVLTARNDVPQVGQGNKVWHTVWVTPKTKGMVQAFFKALGIPSGTDFAADSLSGMIQKMVDAVKGLPVRAAVDLQKENDSFNEVKKFLAPTVDGFYEVTEDNENDGVTTVDASDENVPF
jgi:hypothetical protein